MTGPCLCGAGDCPQCQGDPEPERDDDDGDDDYQDRMDAGQRLLDWAMDRM